MGVVLIFGLVVASVPLVRTAILAEFNNDDILDVFDSGSQTHTF